MKTDLRLMWELARRDLQGRYAGSVAGRAWLLLQPLLLIAIYALIFSRLVVVRTGGEGGLYRYVLYLCSGLLPWICLESSLKGAAPALIGYAGLLKKQPLAVATPVVAAVLAQHLVLLAALAAFWLFALAVGAAPAGSLLYYPVVLLLQGALLVGLALIAALLSAYWRDVPEGISAALALLFWLTPIAYTEETLPAAARPWVAWNPALYLVRLYHRLFFERSAPLGSDLGALALFAAAAFAAGLWLCRRVGRDALDQL